jgi:hypothetical protein
MVGYISLRAMLRIGNEEYRIEADMEIGTRSYKCNVAGNIMTLTFIRTENNKAEALKAIESNRRRRLWALDCEHDDLKIKLGKLHDLRMSNDSKELENDYEQSMARRNAVKEEMAVVGALGRVKWEVKKMRCTITIPKDTILECAEFGCTVSWGNRPEAKIEAELISAVPLEEAELPPDEEKGKILIMGERSARVLNTDDDTMDVAPVKYKPKRHRANHTLDMCGRWLVMAGGVDSDGKRLDEADILDTKSGTWTHARGRANVGQATASDGRCIWITGGLNEKGGFENTIMAKLPCGDVSLWNDPHPELAEKPIPISVAFHDSVTSPMGVHVIGGRTAAGPSRDHYVYDPRSRSWIKTNNTYVALERASSVCVGNRIYRFGGSGVKGPVKTAYAWDPVSKNYEKLANMPKPRSGHKAVLRGGFVYIIGGDTPLPVWKFNIAANTWSVVDAENSVTGPSACVAVN